MADNKEYLDHIAQRMTDILNEELPKKGVMTLNEVLDALGEDNPFPKNDSGNHRGWVSEEELNKWHKVEK